MPSCVGVAPEVCSGDPNFAEVSVGNEVPVHPRSATSGLIVGSGASVYSGCSDCIPSPANPTGSIDIYSVPSFLGVVPERFSLSFLPISQASFRSSISYLYKGLRDRDSMYLNQTVMPSFVGSRPTLSKAQLGRACCLVFAPTTRTILTIVFTVMVSALISRKCVNAALVTVSLRVLPVLVVIVPF